MNEKHIYDFLIIIERLDSYRLLEAGVVDTYAVFDDLIRVGGYCRGSLWTSLCARKKWVAPFFSFFLTLVGALPVLSLKKAYNKKSRGGIKAHRALVQCGNGLCWMIYGILARDPFTITLYGVAFLCFGLQLLAYIWYLPVVAEDVGTSAVGEPVGPGVVVSPPPPLFYLELSKKVCVVERVSTTQKYFNHEN